MCTEVRDSLNKPIKSIFRRALRKDLKTLSLGFSNFQCDKMFSGSLQSSFYRDSTVY